MITLSELYPVGFVAKTHGIKGELNVSLDTDYNPEDFRFLVFDIDSIFIPFEVESSRGKGSDNRLVALKGVDTVEEARLFVGKTAYVLLKELRKHPDYNEDEDEQGLYLSDLVGFTVMSPQGETLGSIVGFNDDTLNYLLEIEKTDGSTTLVPYVEDWIESFDPDTKTLVMDIPEGLTD